jgi:K+-sensing histidine kinase KdpD
VIIDWVIGLHIACFLIPSSVLLFSYRRCDPVNKARIRWILFSLLGLVIAYILSITAGRLDVPFEVLNLVGTVLTAATFVGFAYAVLKHRLVSLQFVLNRALVYGLITSLVVGVFAAMLSFLEHETLNTETNRSLALLVPLILGMGLNTLKRNVDEYINKIFFRHRHKAEASLAQFARTCAYVENPDTLLDLTADELFRHGTPQSLAIYLTEPGKAGAKLVRQRGNGSYTAHLNIDDLGLLRLRAGDLEVDLHGVASGLGAEGNVYALTVRGQVLGLIVLGARPAEAYTQEERRLFALVAHQVAVALHALRLEEEHRLLKELAEGTFKSLPTAQAKAKELMGATG